MILVTHRCTAGHEVEVFAAFGAEPRTTCEAPECSAPCVRVISKPPKTKIRHALKRTDCVDYREDLARFPNDPEAWVDGPQSLQKLIDKRKRAGWEMKPVSEASRPHKPPEVDGEKLVRDSYEEALKQVSEE